MPAGCTTNSNLPKCPNKVNLPRFCFLYNTIILMFIYICLHIYVKKIYYFPSFYIFSNKLNIGMTTDRTIDPTMNARKIINTGSISDFNLSDASSNSCS